MKALVLNGSPRRGGNTDCLTAKAAEGMRSKSMEVEEVFLSSLKIHPCTGCEACASIEAYCVFDDDMLDVCRKVAESDVLFFASPVYWFNVTTYIKLAMDRFFGAFMKDEAFLKGKKLGFAFCYGDKEPLESGVVNAFRNFQDIAAYTGAEIVGLVHGCAQDPGEIQKNSALMKEAFDLGVKLAR